MRHRRMTFLLISMMLPVALLSGCGNVANHASGLSNQAGTFIQPAIPQQDSYVAVDSSSYDSATETVTLSVHTVSRGSSGPYPAGENILDVSTDHGAVNYALAHYPEFRVRAVRLRYAHQPPRTIGVPSDMTEPLRQDSTSVHSSAEAPSAVEALAGSRLPAGSARKGNVPIPPPGASIDHTIYWRVTLTAPVWMKENAVINEAKSKLGTPYIWGHNEDRGQYGFDCSNFTAYVYHHALGYKFTGASRGQAKYVGVSVPVSDMRRGDLIIFENGKHVGIYVGNHRMINEGGGLGKVGYLSLGPRSYWGKHITDVKRLF